MRCPHCGNELPKGATVCEFCGAREERTSPSSSCLLQLVALILWWIGITVVAALISNYVSLGLGVLFWVFAFFTSSIWAPLLLAKLRPDKTTWIRSGRGPRGTVPRRQTPR